MKHFSTLEELGKLVDDILVKQDLNPLSADEFGDFGARWDGDENHLEEILGGWFCPDQIGSSWTPPGKPQGFVLRWKNWELSRERLRDVGVSTGA